METKEWVQIAANLGLPAILVLWWMLRMEKFVRELTKVLVRVEKSLDTYIALGNAAHNSKQD